MQKRRQAVMASVRLPARRIFFQKPFRISRCAAFAPAFCFMLRVYIFYTNDLRAIYRCAHDRHAN
jgi:hypothetical protein